MRTGTYSGWWYLGKASPEEVACRLRTEEEVALPRARGIVEWEGGTAGMGALRWTKVWFVQGPRKGHHGWCATGQRKHGTENLECLARSLEFVP